jgi:uncharacterized protein
LPVCKNLLISLSFALTFWQSPAFRLLIVVQMFKRFNAFNIRLALVLLWLVIFFNTVAPWQLLLDYGAFAFLGILGAVFANATGAGGGVVFVPFFNQLGFSAETTVATSFAIQCGGMTAGALTWWGFYHKENRQAREWLEFSRALLLTVPVAIVGVMMAQHKSDWFGRFANPENLHFGFGVFSILLALAIFASIPLLKREPIHRRFHLQELIILPLLALVGGSITAWLSVGVGELVAVYLIIRGFNVTFAIATAVILSAFTVWGGIVFHLFYSHAVYWPVVLFAGAGAIIGGILAKRVVLYFSPTYLKIFFATWILLLGVSVLPF